MALQLIYGNSGSGKSTYIYEKVIQMAQADRRRNCYVIVPEQCTIKRSGNWCNGHRIMSLSILM